MARRECVVAGGDAALRKLRKPATLFASMRCAPLILLLATVASSCGTDIPASDDGDEDAACADGSFRSTTGACQVWAECAAGSRVVSEPSATADRACTGCATGTFSSAANSPACSAWAECAAGSYVSNVPSATVDRACAACVAGTTTASANLSSCVSDPCAPGSALEGDACVACSTGSYCAGGVAAGVTCATGTWDHDANPATLCAEQTTCVAGEVVTLAGTAITDRACAPCPADAFSAAPNSPSCTPRLVCEDGTTSEDTPTSSACNVCDGGTWDDDGDPETACVAQAVCEPGEYVAVAGTPTVAIVCDPCAAETFSTVSNAAACLAWTTCSAPEAYMTSAPSETQDRACDLCPDVTINSRTLATYTSEDNAAACCTYPSPETASVIANVGLEGSEETARFGGACTNIDGCQLLNVLPAIDTHTFNSYANLTDTQCASAYSYRWEIRYPSNFNGGITYRARGITGTTTDAVTIVPDSLPDIGGLYWRVRVTVTNTATGIALERRFRFMYSDSSSSYQLVTSCQSSTPPSSCPENILLPL